MNEIVGTLRNVLGRPIRYIPITDEQWAEAVKGRLNAHALDHLTNLWRSFRNRAAGVPVTDAIRTITGQNPQSLEEFFRAQWPIN